MFLFTNDRFDMKSNRLVKAHCKCHETKNNRENSGLSQCMKGHIENLRSTSTGNTLQTKFLNIK